MSFRLLALCTVAAFAVAPATTVAAPPVAAPMRITIDINVKNHDGAASPNAFAVRAGGTVTLSFRNHSRLFHTFTVRALGISLLIRPARGGNPRTTSITFVAPYGVYSWECVLCTSGAHGHMHAMHGMMYAIIDT